MINYIMKIWKLKDLRNRILFTIGLLLIIRVLAHIPLPFIDTSNLQKFFSNNPFLGILNMFTGGTMENFSIILMGVGPYITATIIIQLLQMIVPSVEALSKEGEQGRQKLNYYSRLITVPLAIIQSWSMIKLLQSQKIVGSLSFSQLLILLIIATAGTILVMWIGEIITERGISNGISLIIAFGIIAGLPGQIANTRNVLELNHAPLLFVAIMTIIAVLLIIAFIILMTEGERQIPISYARRIKGTRTYGGVETHLPLRINSAGVIPIIFALSMVTFPPVLAQFLTTARSEFLKNIGNTIYDLFNNNNFFYGALYFIMVVAFTYFYTYIVFKPKEVAENLQKNGGFIPGMRPGRETSNYLSYIISRITLTGAIFLAFIAVLPFIVSALYPNLSTIQLGGTSILIVVSVIIETMRQLQSEMLMRTYEKY
ncbi:MAG: preprotein translocase subunit SecY [bacterium]|nr:preprotein translocase subunit SecY [bacterium]